MPRGPLGAPRGTLWEPLGALGVASRDLWGRVGKAKRKRPQGRASRDARTSQKARQEEAKGHIPTRKISVAPRRRHDFHKIALCAAETPSEPSGEPSGRLGEPLGAPWGALGDALGGQGDASGGQPEGPSQESVSIGGPWRSGNDLESLLGRFAKPLEALGGILGEPLGRLGGLLGASWGSKKGKP